MLERYGRIARAIYPFRVVLYLGIVACAGLFIYALVSEAPDGQETRMFLPLVGVLWCVCLAMFTHGFSGEFPVVDEQDGFIRRNVIRLIRGFWHLVAIGVVAFGCATLMLTARALAMFGT